MTRPTLTPAEWLDLVAAKAPALREAGVREVQLDGCALKLSAFEPEPEERAEDAAPVFIPDAMDDPTTYPGGKVPGYRRRQGANS